MRMIPFARAVDTLVAGFQLGVNIVHTAADYAGSMDVVSEARKRSEHPVFVCSNGWGSPDQFEAIFEEALQKFGGKGATGQCQLPFFGVASVEDRELLGENVWGCDGMVEFLSKQKRKGRLLHTFCTSHGSPSYIQGLIESDAFDAVMFAYNPLGYHILSFNPPDKRGRECLSGNQELFALAAAKNIGIMLMEVLAGGLLCRSEAYSLGPCSEARQADVSPPLPTASEVLRYILRNEPAITCVMPGVRSVDEARENAQVGHVSLSDTRGETERLTAAIDHLHATICQRCGECEETCSQSLPISWLFRAADIFERGAVPFETPLDKLYFNIHPASEAAICAGCESVTCRCPHGLDIPRLLTGAHAKMFMLLQKGEVPGPIEPILPDTATYAARLASVSSNITFTTIAVQNIGRNGWHVSPIHPTVSLEMRLAGYPVVVCSLRADVGVGEIGYFSFDVPDGVDSTGAEVWVVFRCPGEDQSIDIQVGSVAAEASPHALQSEFAVRYVTHKISPMTKRDGICELAIELENIGQAVWNDSRTGANDVDVVIYLQDTIQTVSFDREVNPLQRITVSIPIDVPAATGSVTVTIDLVCQNRAFFSALGSPPLMLALELGTPTAQVIPRYAADFVEHRAPNAANIHTRFGIWVRVRNTGAMPWDVDSRRGQQVSATIKWNDEVIASTALPHSVGFSETVDLHMVVPSPACHGVQKLQFNLVHEGVSFFHDRGVRSLELDLVVKGKEPAGAALYGVALRRNSSFYHPSGGVSRLADGSILPQLIERAKGCHVWDADGRRYIDYTMGWGCALLGYGHDLVEAAVRRVMACGPTLPLPHRLEMELSEDICEKMGISCAEAITFGKNGSDVCTLAVRLARVATGRKTVIVCGYHGWQDWYAETLGFAGAGVPERDPPLVIRASHDDQQHLLDAIFEHAGDLAAVILEPSGAAGGKRMVGEDVNAAWLNSIAVETRRAGALLVFDEIITGFRYPGGSVQQAFGIVPDLTCFGKALGNGFPVSALVGTRQTMSLMSQTFYGPTFKGELYSLAAARAALSIYRSEPVADHVWQYGTRLREEIGLICQRLGVNAELAGPPFRFVLHFKDADINKRNLSRTLYLQELLRGGLITYSGVMLPSFAHGEDELNESLSTIEKSLQRVRDCEADGHCGLHRAIEIPLVRPFV